MVSVWWTTRSRISLLPPLCSGWRMGAAGASCLDWGPWEVPAPGWDCCWAPPRALDSCVPFTASGGNGRSAMTRASSCPTPWTARRLQSRVSRVRSNPLRPQTWLTDGPWVQTAFSRACGTGQHGRGVCLRVSPFWKAY